MPTLIIQHSPRSTGGVLTHVLRDHGLRMVNIRLDQGESIPSDLDDVDGIVSLGGSPSATDDTLPWIAAELKLLKAAHELSIPILGICLGSQLLAKALGGTVRRMDGPPSVGLPTINLTPEGRENPLFRGVPWYGQWPSWHEDEVSELPGGSVLLAKSEACGVEAWHNGVFSYGVQFHPEWNSSMLNDICDDPSRLPAGNVSDIEAIRSEGKERAESINRMAHRFAENIAGHMLLSDRKNAGASRDMIH